MQQGGYYLFRGAIWYHHPQSQCTRVRFDSAKGFVGHLCANPDLIGELFDHMGFLEKLLADEQCTVIPQLQLDVDVIEVHLSISLDTDMTRLVPILVTERIVLRYICFFLHLGER